MASRVLTGMRLSEVARCPRMAACRGLGYEPAEPGEQARMWLARGNVFEAYVARQFAAKHGDDNIERQREVHWPLGIGHIDIYVIPQRLIVEVVSTTSPDGILAKKVKQAKLYLHFDGEAERAAVYVVNPANLQREDMLPVRVTANDVEEFGRDITAIRDALEGGPLPECAAANPTECRRGYFCQFTEQAWAGWEPPQAVDLSDDREAVSLASRLYTIQRRRARRGQEEKADKQAQDDLQAALVERGVLPKLPYVLGGVQLTRTVVKGRETFRYSAAKTAGVVDEEFLAPYVRVGEPHDRFTLKRLDGLDLDTNDDYDEAAPF